MSKFTFKPYTIEDVRNAEILLQGTAGASLDAKVRARAKMVLALIDILDAYSYTWRQDLADRVNEARASGCLEDFDPDAPFDLIPSNDDLLAALNLGPANGLSLVPDPKNARRPKH